MTIKELIKAGEIDKDHWLTKAKVKDEDIEIISGLVVWCDGIWEEGIWENGVWCMGEWRKGIWVFGIWNDGDWMDGTWKNGVWKKGEWHSGMFHDGVWEGGTIWNNKRQRFDEIEKWDGEEKRFIEKDSE